jgi:hypothetical protein
MTDPTVEQLQAQIAAPQERLAILQSGSGGQAVGSGKVAAGERGFAVGRDFIGNIYQGTPPKNDAEAIAIYRRMLAGTCRQLPLRGVHVGASDPTRGEMQMDLDQVYVSLDTTAQFQPEEKTSPKGLAETSWLQRLASKILPGSRPQPAEDRPTLPGRDREETRPLPVLLAAALNRRVVLLGDPGSGKSTFVNHLSLCLALHGLEPANHWREVILLAGGKLV